MNKAKWNCKKYEQWSHSMLKYVFNATDYSNYCGVWTNITAVPYGRQIIQSKCSIFSSNVEHIFSCPHRYRITRMFLCQSVSKAMSQSVCLNLTSVPILSWLNADFYLKPTPLFWSWTLSIQHTICFCPSLVLSLFLMSNTPHFLLPFTLNALALVCPVSPLSPSMIFVYRAACLAFIRVIL